MSMWMTAVEGGGQAVGGKHWARDPPAGCLPTHLELQGELLKLLLQVGLSLWTTTGDHRRA
jgi:hypothetical protein